MKEVEPRAAQLLAHAVLLGVEEFRLAAEDRMGSHVIDFVGNEPEAVKFLEGIASAGLLEKHVSDILYRCPVCGGSVLRPKLLCPRCQSLDLKRGILFIHLTCSYVGFQEDFKSANICPRCGESLLDNEAYHKAGSGYRCSSCSISFHRPKEKWVCVSCGYDFELDDSRIEVSSSYKLTKLGLVAGEGYAQGLREIIHTLLAKGMRVSFLDQLQGLSGAMHESEISAEDGESYVIATSLFREAKAIELIKFYSLIHDSDARGVFIAMPGVDPEARDFVMESRISSRLSLLESSSISEMKQKLWNFFSPSSKLPNLVPVVTQ
jgi:hypothetical protein